MSGLISRRRILKGGLTGVAALTTASWLVACGNDDDSAEGTSTTTGGSSGGGGNLRLGAVGAATDNLNPTVGTSRVFFTTAAAIYDPLARIIDGAPVLVLAEELEPNADATSWTLRIREGATFHDGAAVTADDVLFTLGLLAKEESLYAAVYGDLDVANLRRIDERTLEMPLRQPRADWIDNALVVASFVVPDGTTDFTGIGSGPFRLDSFSPGASARLVANEDYWGGAPKLESVELQAINDATARLNALRSGQIDFATDISAASARAEAGNDSIVVIRSDAPNAAYSFIMNTALPPFDDPDVRRALRLAIDRQALVDTILLGEGEVANDLMGLGLPGYDDRSPQTPHDPDAAQELLEAAGVTSLTIRAGEVGAGLVDAAELFAQQLRELGVDTQVNEIPADQYYGEELFTSPLQTWGIDNESPGFWLGLTTGPESAFPLGGPSSEAYNERFLEWRSTVDEAARNEAFQALQEQYREEGGMLTWGFGYAHHAAATNVSDVGQSGQAFLLGEASIS